MSTSTPLLSVGAAAERLGVHVSTVRRWTADGVLAVVRTPGGHRRISVAAIEGLRRERMSEHDAPAPDPLEPASDASPADQAWAEHAVVHTRYEIQSNPSAAWNQSLSNDSRAHRRETGRQLMGLLLRHVAGQGDPEAREAEVRRLSWGYALDMKDRGLRLTEALRATLFFRDVLTESTAFRPRFGDDADPVALVRSVNEFMNTVQMTIAEAYEEPDA